MTKRKDPSEIKKRGCKTSARTLELIELVQTNSHMERLELMQLIWQRYPDYSEDQFRMLIWTYKLKVKPSPRRNGPPPTPPGRVKPKPGPVRAAVHSYHGRSRLQPGYYEL